MEYMCADQDRLLARYLQGWPLISNVVGMVGSFFQNTTNTLALITVKLQLVGSIQTDTDR